MPDQSFKDFFAGQRMTLLADSYTVKPGIPKVLPAGCYEPGATKPYNDQVQWPAITWNRGGATVVSRNSPPRPINVGATDWKFATLLNMKEEMDLDPMFLQSLASDFAPIRENAERELERRMKMFNMRFETTRINIVNSMFANANVWIGSDGQVLASSSGAVITLSGNVATANQITKNGGGGTYNIGDWSSPTTDVITNLLKIRNANLQANSFMLQRVLYGTSLPAYLANNTTLAAYFARSPSMRETLLTTSTIPDGFLGWNWTPVHLAFSVKLANVNDTTGTATQTFADNFIGIMPEISPEWYEFVEGGTQVPNGIAAATQVDVNASMQSMLGAFDIRYGKYAYGVIKTYPIVGQGMVQGDCCGPVLKTPGTYYYGTCS